MMQVRGKRGNTPRVGRRYALVPRLTPLLAATAAWPCVASAVTYTATNTVDMGNGAAQAIAATQQGGLGAFYQSASLWTTSSSGALNLNPNGFTSTSILATTGTRQAGYGWSSSKGHWHALLWTGTSQTAIDLNPTNLPGYTDSYAYGIAGNQQFGEGIYQDPNDGHLWTRALLWTGSANSAVNLNPTNLTNIVASRGYTTDGVHQGGWGLPTGANNNSYHAMLWSGTADSAVDLHPTNLTGFSNSIVLSLSGNQQVGQGTLTGGTNTHALLWSGTSDSAVDLNPTNFPGFATSSARATNGAQQAGYGQGTATGGTNAHALVWSGTADTAIDLNPLVPGGATGSHAYAIDAYGNIAGEATVNGNQHAIVWLAGDMFLGTSQLPTSWGNTAWSSGKPIKNSDVLLVSSNGTSRTVTYDFSTTSITLGTLTIDATDSASMTLEQDANTLTTTNDLVGVVGSGTFNQPAGRHVVNGTLTLGARPASTGTYTLGPSATLSAANVQINAGSTFTQNGGPYTSASLANNGSFTQTAGNASFGAVTGTGSLTLAGTATASVLAQGALSLTGSGKLTLAAADTTPILLHSLTITSASAYLDTASHPFLLTYTGGPSPIDQVRQYLLTHELRSAATAADPQRPLSLAYAEASVLPPEAARLLAGGSAPDPSTLLVTLALPGDANLDGQITPDDYTLLDRSLSQHPASAHWTDGDFNYDGAVDASDYLLIDRTLGQARGFSPDFLAQRESQFGPAYVQALLTSVPEPTTAALLLFALPLLPTRRPRHTPKNLLKTEVKRG